LVQGNGIEVALDDDGHIHTANRCLRFL